MFTGYFSGKKKNGFSPRVRDNQKSVSIGKVDDESRLEGGRISSRDVGKIKRRLAWPKKSC